MRYVVAAIFLTTLIAGSLCAANNKQTAVRGTDDLSRYVAAQVKPGGRAIVRDASGRTLGTATRAGTVTTFRDHAGRTTGTTTVEGKRTVFWSDGWDRDASKEHDLPRRRWADPVNLR